MSIGYVSGLDLQSTDEQRPPPQHRKWRVRMQPSNTSLYPWLVKVTDYEPVNETIHYLRVLIRDCERAIEMLEESKTWD